MDRQAVEKAQEKWERQKAVIRKRCEEERAAKEMRGGWRRVG